MPTQKIVIVTGGGRGIGRAVAARFAADGDLVVAVSRTESDLTQTKSSIEKSGGTCHTHACDVSSAKAVQALIDDTIKRFKRIDVLVNNAGVAPVANIEDLTEETFDRLWAVNVKAMYLMSRAAWPALKQARGAIVNISSIASRDPFAGLAAYGASKAWVNAWTSGLAAEGRAQGVRVFAIAPGAVETQMLHEVVPDFPKQDILDPDDVAAMIHAVAQPACRYATGQTIFYQRQGD